jgi:hypothetical protein
MDFLHTCGVIIDMSQLEWGFATTWPNEVFALNCSKSTDLSYRHLQQLQEFQVDESKDILKQFPDVIYAPLGRVKLVKHRIEIVEENSRRQRPYPMSQIKLEEVNREVDYMLVVTLALLLAILMAVSHTSRPYGV